MNQGQQDAERPLSTVGPPVDDDAPPRLDALADPFLLENAWAPNAVIVCGTASPLSLGSRFTGFRSTGVAGCGLDLTSALARCRGEAIEYLSQLSPADDPLLEEPDVVLGYTLDTQEPIRLPAQACLRYAEHTDPLIGSGVAAGRTWDEAVASGLWELIERDAISAWWHGNHPARPLQPEDAAQVADYLGVLRRTSAARQTHVLNITLRDDLPVVTACSFDARGRGFVAGFAAHPNLLEAACKALRELVQMEASLQLTMSKWQGGRWDMLNQHEQRELQRAQSIAPSHRAFRTDGQPIQSRPPLALHETLAVLRCDGVAVHVVDLTRAAFAVPVAKVFAPGLASMATREADIVPLF